MVEIEELKGSLLDLVRRAGRVSADELLKWAEERQLAPLTLYILVEEVLSTGEVRGRGGRRVIDEHFNIDIPLFLELAKEETLQEEQQPLSLLTTPRGAPRATHERRERARPRRRARPTGGSLLRFLTADEAEEHMTTGVQTREEGSTAADAGKTQEAVAAAETEGPASLPSPPPPQPAEQQVPPELAEILADEDLAKAIRYLGRYWSVGRLRFLEDLEELGVKNPKKVLEELWRRGLIELVEPGFGGAGVINATEALLELAEKVQPATRSSLFEIFSR
uniref:Uncharacterized protein n=1 Tax=Thermofilum pendens TaxID=2269 RepID=A0A7C3WTG8_THEPE